MESETKFEESKSYLVGGVNSPVRAMKPYPFLTKQGKGATLTDIDGKEYIDYCLGYGPLILGHANPEIVDTVKSQLGKGNLYGTPTEIELEFAKKITEYVPNVDKIRTVNTGTEATMCAIRLARGVTGKDKVIKYEGAFHGAHDYVLVKAGSGAMTHGTPDSSGVPVDSAKNTLLVGFNDTQALSDLMEKEGDDVSCLIIEPIIGNAGCILPKEGYLEEVRKITAENDVLLIFDEVITGFRIAMGGAQEYYGIDADIVTLGKVVGGGFPIGIFGSKAEFMDQVSPLGSIYNAGTFNGNPISVSAGLKTLEILERGKVHPHLDKIGTKMRSGLKDIGEDLKFDLAVQGVGGMYQAYFNPNPVYDYNQSKASDAETFLRYQKELLKMGVFLPPSQFECNFVSIAHTEEIADSNLELMETAMRNVSK